MVWREVINEAARRAGAPEAALAMIDDLGLLDVNLRPEARWAYEVAVREVMDDLVAEEDVVIVGRAGQVILADRPDVLHVRVIAPLPLRVERIASTHRVPTAAARARVEQSDRTRRDYLRTCYDVDWDDPRLYDLVLNTEQLTVEGGADLVCETLARRDETNDEGALEKGDPGLG
jgi:cytidylate kinase